MTLQRTPAMRPPSVRDQVHQIADALAPEATWEDVRYQIELRASIERGLADIGAGRVVSFAELMAEFDIAE